MSKQDRARWDSKYATSAPPGRPQTSIEWVPPAREGAWALDIACGRGRHAIALQGLGYRVVAVDLAFAPLRAPALVGATAIYPVQADLDAWPFGRAAFDLIVQYDFLDRALFPAIRDSLRPAGLLLIDTFRTIEDEVDKFGPSHPGFRLASGELEQAFGDWEIVESSEQDATDDQATRAAILVRRSR